MKFLFRLILVCAVVFSALFLQAQQTDETYNIPVRYLLALPEGYQQDTAKKWPLIIFLHGSGESGDSLNKVKVHGPPKLIEQGKKFPFIVISPQARMGIGWNVEVMEIFLRDLKKQYRIDPQRIYLTGLSMGGFGTWAWASKYSKEFAAIAPICGGGDTTEARKLKNVPVWCFHGAKDDVVNPQESRNMVAAVKKYNPDVRLTIYPNAKHDSWTETYNNDSLYTWFLEHEKLSLKPITLDETELKDFAGVYSRTGTDTLKIVLQDGKLVAKTGGPDIEVIPYSKNDFFINESDQQFEIKFVRNKKGKVEKFVFYGDRPMEFKKID